MTKRKGVHANFCSGYFTNRLLSCKKIILFGSQARGTADNRSDIDLLVICPIKGKRHNLMVKMNSILGELDYAFEVVILTSEEFERDSRIPGTIGRYASQ